MLRNLDTRFVQTTLNLSVLNLILTFVYKVIFIFHFGFFFNVDIGRSLLNGWCFEYTYTCISVSVFRMRKFKLYTCLLTVDTPDPYVLLRIPTAPSGKRKTKIVDNNPNPEWNETFEFYLDPDRKHVLRKVLGF